MQKCQTVNDDSSGLESGMREMKQCFRPSGFHSVLTAKQVARLPVRISTLPDTTLKVSTPLIHTINECTQFSPPTAITTNEKSLKASPSRTRNKTLQGVPGPYPKVRYELRPSLMLSDQVELFALVPFQTEEILLPYSYFDETRLITMGRTGNIGRNKTKQGYAVFL